MSNVELIAFLRDLMQRKKRLPSQLAADLGVSHPTIGRWMRDEDIPNPTSCQALAEYSGEPLQKVLCLAGHVSLPVEEVPDRWPAFAEYVRRKYPKVLEEDLIEEIEGMIERKMDRMKQQEKPLKTA